MKMYYYVFMLKSFIVCEFHIDICHINLFYNVIYILDVLIHCDPVCFLKLNCLFSFLVVVLVANISLKHTLNAYVCSNKLRTVYTNTRDYNVNVSSPSLIKSDFYLVHLYYKPQNGAAY